MGQFTETIYTVYDHLCQYYAERIDRSKWSKQFTKSDIMDLIKNCDLVGEGGWYRNIQQVEEDLTKVDKLQPGERCKVAGRFSVQIN